MITEIIEPQNAQQNASIEISVQKIRVEETEDIFECARRAFFSDEEGRTAPLSKPETFTQVKSFDGPKKDKDTAPAK